MAKRKKPGRGSVSPGGLIKKTFWFPPEEEELLRRAAFDRRLSQGELVRAAVRLYLGVATGDELADAVTARLDNDPDYKESLRSMFEEYSDRPEEAEELFRALAGEESDG